MTQPLAIRPTRRSFIATTGFGSVAAVLNPSAATAALPARRPRPSPAQLAWQRERLSMFVHFTVNTFTGKEWGDGSENPSIFNPSRLDARQWARTARRNGFGSMILTAKHHDGFCLWPTATTMHSVAASPWRDGRGDVVREFAEACRAEGLKVGLYLSPWDRNASVYGQGRAYDDFYIAQLTELLTRYGPIVQMWFDGANGEGPNGRRQNYDWPRIHAAVRRLQPGAVIFSDAGPDVRWIGNESGEAGFTCWSSVDPERVPHPGFSEHWVQSALMQGDPHGRVWRPGEADVSIRPGWFWRASENGKVRSAGNLLDLYSKSVGRNSKLLLNVPPTSEGLFHEKDVASLNGFGSALRQMLGRDLLERARVRSSSGGTAPEAVLHGDGRHWRAPAAARSGWIEFELPAPVRFDALLLEEAIEYGQHIANHRVEAWQGTGWKTIWSGTTIGHQRLARIAPCTASRLRVVVEFAYATPRLQRVGLLRWPEPLTEG